MIIFNIIKKLKKVLSLNALQVILAAALLNVTFGVCFYFVERNTQEGLTLIDSLWWSMVTMTTVGYGDYYAQTFVGRFLISYPCMLLGIGIIGYLVGAVANYFIEWSARKRRGELKIKERGHIIICNFPNEEKVLDVIQELKAIPAYADRVYVLVADSIRELPEKLVKADVRFVFGTTRDEDTLLKANVLACEGVVILAKDPHEARSDDRTYTTGSLIESLSEEHGKAIKTVAEMVSEKSLRTIARANVDGTVSTDGVASCLLAQEFYHPGVNGVISQMITATHGSQLYLYRTRLVGRRLVRLQQAVLEHDANIQIIGIIHEGKSLLNPDKQTRISEGDTLIILAENESDLPIIERDLLAAG